MPEVFLHVGLARTGTSWLQRCVFPKMALNFVHCNNYDVVSHNLEDKNLFSFEGLSGTVQGGNRYALLFGLKRLFPTAGVIVVLRDKSSYVRSVYHQYVKGGGVWSFDDFSGWFCCDSHGFLDWEGYLTRLYSVFPKVLVLDYSYLRDNPLGFVGAICSFVGVPIPDDVDYCVVNRSVGFVGLRRFVNRFFRSFWNKDAFLPRFLNPFVVLDRMSEVVRYGW